MDKLREQFKKLTGLEPPNNMSKVMLEKHVTWYSQLPNKQSEKELRSLIKGERANSQLVVKSGTKLVREYQGKKHEVTIVTDGDSHSSHPNGCFFYGGIKYKSLSKIAREITGTNWNGKVFFGVSK